MSEQYGPTIIYKNNYLGGEKATQGGWEYVTLAQYTGDSGKCRLKKIAVNELPFKPAWYPLSIRGYHQAADVVGDWVPDMSDAVIRWNIRIPENGGIGFFETKEERDTNLLDVEAQS